VVTNCKRQPSTFWGLFFKGVDNKKTAADKVQLYALRRLVHEVHIEMMTLVLAYQYKHKSLINNFVCAKIVIGCSSIFNLGPKKNAGLKSESQRTKENANFRLTTPKQKTIKIKLNTK
jgi:hypothetical protein